MGRFDRLVDACFDKDSRGNTLFFMHGKFAKGRVLPDEGAEKDLRAWIERFHKLFLGSCLAVIVLFGANWIIPLIAIFPAWFYFGLKPKVSGYSLSDEVSPLRKKFSAA